MKRVMILGILMILFSGFVLAESGCVLTASLVNQDPYPAVPGEDVKLVFQLDGIGNPSCQTVGLEVIPAYPFSLVPGQNASISVRGGVYVTDYKSHLTAPFQMRVDENAVDGNSQIEVRHKSSIGGSKYVSQKFDVNIKAQKVDFEVSVKDYDSATNTITFEILNVGKYNVEALTIEVPKQTNLNVKGSNRNIVGGLDANEDTTFSFEGTPKDGEIDMVIYYNDEIGVRRNTQTSVTFDFSYFKGRVKDQKSTPTSYYVVGLIILLVAGWFIRKRFFKKKKVN